MTIEGAVRALAGALILATLALGYWVHPGFFIATAFIGANLLQSSVTKWCLMEDILRKTGLHREGGEESASKPHAEKDQLA